MDYLKSLASIYYIGIGCGLCSKEEVIEWADMVIEAVDNPPIELLDISMMSKSKIDDVERKLFELCLIQDEENFVKLVLSLILEKIKQEQLPIGKAIRITTRLLVYTGLSWESEYYDLYSFDDSYDLAIGGVVQNLPAEVEQEFVEELGAFQKYFNEFKEMYYIVLRQETIK
ncbi:protein kinase [Bacillus alkalicellulosilyticus]|uniref:protein kinase n=1 Tax=Alkalihalobacterium alkalicellulosilyticum TaxID=1912214 RepID=UPI0009971213|nr:protein kinase [Bacillus alkalicellulosilyticus]